MEYLPEPTPDQLGQLGHVLGGTVAYRRRILGGLGATTDVLELVDSGRLLVLRRHGPWYEDEGIDVVARELSTLTMVRGHGLPAAEPLWGESSGIFESSAIVTSFVDGYAELAPSDWESWAEQLATALVQLHAIAVDDSTATVLARGAPGGDDDETPENFFDNPDARPLLDRLHEVRARTELGEPTLIHGDFWPGNTLWRAGRLEAIIDWENAALADPAADVAYCASDMRYLGLDEAADHLIATYRDQSGRALESLEYWNLASLCRPMPDIAIWVPAWLTLGLPDTDVDEVRQRHHDLIKRALAATA